MPRSRSRLLALVGLLLAAAAVLAACSGSSSKSGPTSSSGANSGGTTAGAANSSGTSSSPAATPSSSGAAKADAGARTVRVSSQLSDGETVGVGMPIVLSFDPAPTSSAAFTKAVTVTVNGKPAQGAWFWEKPYADQPVQAHYRTKYYWPANATIQVKLPIGGLSAGKGLGFSGALDSLTFKTGDRHVSTVDGATETMTVTSNHQTVKTIKVSLGKASTPTYTGTKIVMQKGESAPGGSTLRPDGAVRMIGPGYNEIVPWSVRITASGEYVHAAPWNQHIGQISTSNGCTNLQVDTAKWFYGFSLLGDVVNYTNTGGTPMPSWDGLGDWNVTWGTWTQGGLLRNHA